MYEIIYLETGTLHGYNLMYFISRHTIKLHPYIHSSRAVIGIGVEEEDKKHTWMEDADGVGIFVLFQLYLLVG